MKNIILAFAVIILIGGGIYVMSKKEVVAPEQSNETVTTEEGQDHEENLGETNQNATTPTNTSTTNTNSSQTSGATKTFTVNGNNFAFDLKTIKVNKGDKVRIIFKNTGGKHDWKIDEFNAATRIINGGEEDTIEFVADKVGSFEYYCSVGSHRAMGMKGTLTVK